MESKIKDTQNQRVFDYMKKYGSINPMQALGDLSVMRLASRISELKDMGVPIVRDMKSSRNRFGEPVRYAEYSLTNRDYTFPDKEKDVA